MMSPDRIGAGDRRPGSRRGWPSGPRTGWWARRAKPLGVHVRPSADHQVESSVPGGGRSSGGSVSPSCHGRLAVVDRTHREQPTISGREQLEGALRGVRVEGRGLPGGAVGGRRCGDGRGGDRLRGECRLPTPTIPSAVRTESIRHADRRRIGTRSSTERRATFPMTRMLLRWPDQALAEGSRYSVEVAPMATISIPSTSTDRIVASRSGSLVCPPSHAIGVWLVRPAQPVGRDPDPGLRFSLGAVV